jgi:hypothetical protein
MVFLWFIVLVWAFLSPGKAFAHGFGQRIDLPLPLDLYLFAAGATVAVSFIVIGLIYEKSSVAQSIAWRFNLLDLVWFRRLWQWKILI